MKILNLVFYSLFSLFSLFSFFLGQGFLASPACANTNEKVVMASFYPLAVTLLNITEGVPGVRSLTLAPQSAGCLHDYQLNPSDMKKLADSLVLVVNGGGSEGFLKKALVKFPRLLIINASKGIDFIPLSQKDVHDHDSDTHTDADVDEHVWLSIDNVILQSRNIAEALSSWDNVHKEQYMKNFENYSAKLVALKKETNEILSPFRGREIITFHQSFSYFAREFGLKIAGVIENNPGIAPDPKTLGNLVSLMKKSGVRSVFTEPQYPSQFAQTLARQTQAKVYSLNTFVSGKLEKDAYIATMRDNAHIIASALTVETEGKK